MACTTISSVSACEDGTFIIQFFCLDENDNITIPTSLYWQLSDKYGNAINSRDFTSGDITGTQTTITIIVNGTETTGSGYTIVLSGDDLAFQSSSDDGVRYIAIKGTYNSDAGIGLNLKGELKFQIQNLINF